LYAAYSAFRPGEFPSPWERLALFGLPSTLMVYGACGMELAGAGRLPRPLMFVGDRSYTLYLTHVPVIVAASLVYSRLTGGGPAAALAAGLFRTAAVGAAAVVAYAAVEQPLHRGARRVRKRWQARLCAAGKASNAL
jgi:peptidoglycan/LPS O-acetylase OafA/YrhL